MTEQKVECTKYFPSGKDGNFLGFANLWVPKMGVEIFNCSIYRNSQNGHRFIKFPSKKGQNQEGKDVWWEQIRFRDKKHHEAFQKLAIDAIDCWCAANQEAPVPPMLKPHEDLPF